jgi:hypothetical protein
MKLINSLLDYSDPWKDPDIYLFTGNPIIKKNGAIVMGRGAARQVRDRYPGIDVVFGKIISEEPHLNVLVIGKGDRQLGWFKVKDHWREPAKLSIISKSAAKLTKLATEHPELRFHMNYPGVGNGHLNVATVAPLLQALPDNVLLYRKDT